MKRLILIALILLFTKHSVGIYSWRQNSGHYRWWYNFNWNRCQRNRSPTENRQIVLSGSGLSKNR